MSSLSSPQRKRLQDNDLEFIRCSYEDELRDVVSILKKQSNHSSLKRLCIDTDDDPPIRANSAKWIANILKTNKSLTDLVFEKNSITSSGVVAIVKVLSSDINSTFTSLAVCFNDMKSNAIVAMSHMLKVNKVLTVLDIEGCINFNAGVIPIADSLKQNTTLEFLNLAKNSIRDVGAIAIADGIKENASTSLASLFLEDNNIGTIGAGSIAAMLSTNKSLLQLDLSGNEMIGPEGFRMIVEALKQNRSLAKLGLRGIPFGNDGAVNIASVLATSFSLKLINMRNCNIGDAGAEAIADALKTNKSLELLTLAFNPISGSIITNHFAPMLEINATLKEFLISIEENPLDEAAAGALLKVLEEYNDTVNVHIYGDTFDDDFFAFEVEAESEELEIMFNKIKDIGEKNENGTRIAPVKAERNRKNVYNGLQLMWGRESA